MCVGFDCKLALKEVLIKSYYCASRTSTDLYCGQIQGDTIYLSAALFWAVYLLKF